MESSNTYCVYRHIRPDKNEPFYIGIGKTGTSRPYAKRRNSLWTNIVNINHGNYHIDILFEDLTLEEADKKEIEFIELYGRIKNNTGTLANFLKGGHSNVDYYKPTKEEIATNRKVCINKGGYKLSKAVRERMSLSRKGRAPWNKGKSNVFSEATRKRMSESHKGNLSNTGNIFITNGVDVKAIKRGSEIPQGWIKGHKKGYKLTEEQRKNISLGHKGMKYKFTDEQLLKKKLRMLGNKSTSGKIWINDGKVSKYINNNEIIPDNWQKGRILNRYL